MFSNKKEKKNTPFNFGFFTFSIKQYPNQFHFYSLYNIFLQSSLIKDLSFHLKMHNSHYHECGAENDILDSEEYDIFVKILRVHFKNCGLDND